MAAAALVYIAIALLLLLALSGILATVLHTASRLAGARGNHARRASSYPASADTLVGASAEALRALGASDVRRAGPGNVILGRTRPSLWSGGEELVVRVAAAGASGASQVEIRSQAVTPGTTIDWGRNRRNVADFHQYLVRLLREAPGD